MREREPRGVQELALQPEAHRPAVLAVADDRMADRAPCGRGSDGCGRSRGRLAAALASPQRLESSKWVRASRGLSVSIECSTRSRRSRPIGASIVPESAPAGIPSTSARYSRRSSRACQQRLERAVHRIALGDDQQARGVAVEPVDDPGPLRVLAAGGAAGQRLRERAGPVAARRMHDDARPACRRRAGARPRRRRV